MGTRDVIILVAILGIAAVGLVVSVGQPLKFKPTPAPASLSITEPEPAPPEPTPEPTPPAVTPPPAAGRGPLAASWTGDCDNSNTNTTGPVDLNYDSNIDSVNGQRRGSQTVRWLAGAGSVQVEIYAGGKLIQQSSARTGQFTQDISRGCLTRVLVYFAATQ